MLTSRLEADLATILIVDDEPDILYVLRLILQSAGHEVIQAVHGAEALEVVSQRRPDLILTDIMMPVMDGHELVQHLRSAPETASIPIVAVSANPDGMREAHAFVPKPFRPKEILEVVGSMLAQGA